MTGIEIGIVIEIEKKKRIAKAIRSQRIKIKAIETDPTILTVRKSHQKILLIEVDLQSRRHILQVTITGIAIKVAVENLKQNSMLAASQHQQ